MHPKDFSILLYILKMFSVTIYLKVKYIQNQKCPLEHNILKFNNYSET